MTTSGDYLWIRNSNVLLLTWLAYCAYVSSRRPFGVVRKEIEEQQGLTPTELGLIDTCFLSMYCLGQLFYGEAKNYFSAKNAIALGLVLSAGQLLLFSNSTSLTSYCVFWAGNGIANAFGWPSCIRIITPWIKPEERGRVMGLWTSCQAAGGIVGNFAATYFLGSYGWRAAVAQSGFFVGAIGLLNYQFLIDHPSQIGCEPLDETSPSSPTSVITENDRVLDENQKDKTPSFFTIIRAPGVLPVATAHFCEKIIRYTLLFWLPYYLTKRLNYSKIVSGYASTAFDVGGVVGSILSGYVADHWEGGSRRTTTAVIFLAGSGVSLLCFAGFPELFEQNIIYPTMTCFAVGLFLLGFDSLLTGAVIQDLATRAGMPSQVSAISGFIGGSGSFGSILQGFLTTIITNHLSWEILWLSLFALVMIACISLTGTIMLELSRTKTDAEHS